MLLLQSLLVVVVVLSKVFSAPPQLPLQIQSTTTRRKLQGRFAHVTDFHPDPYYRPHTSLSSACHRNKPKKEKDRAGYYGTPFSDCDSPLTLSNFTLDFIDKHWASDIDFVIWTGDNARHDNDRKLPRTTSEIYELNRAVARKMEDVFTSKGIPVIPSLGNNDVWPHVKSNPSIFLSQPLILLVKNIMTPGPNGITNEFSSIWKSFIPFPSYQVFQRGAYYSVEVLPNAVAVISTNTMYWYDSNKAVGGCEYKEPEDPGNLQFDWLEVQLETFRSRNMLVWISGHVPPSPGLFFPECYVRYVELSLRFQDTILGHLFGHMNADHFFFVEAGDLEIYPDDGVLSRRQTQSTAKEELVDILLKDFAALPSKIDLDNYSVINVSPSVVPNPYLPTFRIFSYNITGAGLSMGQVHSVQGMKKKKKKKKGTKRRHGHRHGDHEDKKTYCNEHQDMWKCRLGRPWHSDPDAPSRTNKLWSPLGYAQYYIPHLETANKTQKPKYKLEYLTFPPPLLHPSVGGEVRYPLPLRNLPLSLRNATIKKSRYAPYHMKDLTISSWYELARRLGKAKHSKLRNRFRQYMYVGGEEE